MKKYFSVARILSLVFVASVLVRLTIKDRFIGFSTWYYITPWSLLAGLSLIISALYAQKRRFRFALLFWLLAIATCVCWLANGYRRQAPTAVPEAIKLMFWNADHARYGIGKAIVQVQDVDADIVCLVEAGREKEIKEEWKKAFAYQTVKLLFGEMLLTTKGKIIEKNSNDLAAGGRYNWIKLAIKNTEVSIILVDIPPDPLQSRAPAFAELEKVIALHSAENLIIVGDFNTPGDSVHFAPLRENFNNAFEVSGEGFSATWPLPVPLLAIDHIWTKKNFAVYETTLLPSWSDHRALVTYVALMNDANLSATESQSKTAP
ncbi:MAG: endonuclease/exonuclease/phosphatase family protein [Acidobacteriota bacterium]